MEDATGFGAQELAVVVDMAVGILLVNGTRSCGGRHRDRTRPTLRRRAKRSLRDEAT
jgi:hypothetical protein